uniref:Uncharacterized protein n=1 Tax=Opuntia streptacantha TaxID=393608 RepID=A0A7C8YVE7_OPUST
MYYKSWCHELNLSLRYKYLFFMHFFIPKHEYLIVACAYAINLQLVYEAKLWFLMQTMPKWVELQSLSQAKSRIGHAVMMILQVGILEKFKDMPLATSLDLACLAGAVVVSSACIFVLAKLAASRLN